MRSTRTLSKIGKKIFGETYSVSPLGVSHPIFIVGYGCSGTTIFVTLYLKTRK